MGVPPNGWFIMENPMKKLMICGYPLFQETSICCTYSGMENVKSPTASLDSRPPGLFAQKPRRPDPVLALENSTLRWCSKPSSYGIDICIYNGCIYYVYSAYLLIYIYIYIYIHKDISSSKGFPGHVWLQDISQQLLCSSPQIVCFAKSKDGLRIPNSILYYSKNNL